MGPAPSAATPLVGMSTRPVFCESDFVSWPCGSGRPEQWNFARKPRSVRAFGGPRAPTLASHSRLPPDEAGRHRNPPLLSAAQARSATGQPTCMNSVHTKRTTCTKAPACRPAPASCRQATIASGISPHSAHTVHPQHLAQCLRSAASSSMLPMSQCLSPRPSSRWTPSGPSSEPQGGLQVGRAPQSLPNVLIVLWNRLPMICASGAWRRILTSPRKGGEQIERRASSRTCKTKVGVGCPCMPLLLEALGGVVCLSTRRSQRSPRPPAHLLPWRGHLLVARGGGS